MARLFLAILFLSGFVPIAASSAAGQTQDNSLSSSAAKPLNISGKWQVAWQGRLGTEQCTLQLQQDSTNQLKGTLQDLHGVSSLSGTMEGKKVVFDVTIQGLRPYTTRFAGTVEADKIEGTSQAINVGGSGAFLGHGGEIVQPEHPWTAKRAANQAATNQPTTSQPMVNQPTQSGTSGSNPSSRN